MRSEFKKGELVDVDRSVIAASPTPTLRYFKAEVMGENDNQVWIAARNGECGPLWVWKSLVRRTNGDTHTNAC